ncbi:MAG: glycosyltransferase family 39 protein [Chloroflexi bacterium]|nr:glycosyltransferase family 39 protein [Chloroflexota bacterium]
MSRGALALLSAAAALYLFAVGMQLRKPLVYDDANFALAARAVADTGLPYGNQGWMSERGDFSQREQWALWHPPLYVYLIGAASKLGGWTPPALRAVGVIGGLATGWLTYLLAREITRGPPQAREIAGGIAAALCLTCPLVIQSTLVVDIDLALLLPLTLLFLLLYIRLEDTPRWPWLVPLFSLLLWSKMTNPLPLVVIVGVWQVLRGKPGRAGLHFVGIGVGGALLFGATWFIVARLLGFPFDMPFGVNVVQWQDSAEVARRAYASPGAFLEGLQPTVIWIGPALVALGLAGVGVRVAQIACSWNAGRRVDLLIGLLVVLVLGYVNKYAGWFPKYQVAMVPLLAILGASLVAQAWCLRRDLVLGVGAAALALSGLVVALLVHDRWALERTWAIEPPAGIALLSMLLIGTVAAGLSHRARAPAVAAIAVLSGMALGWSVATDAEQMRAAYSTTYWYGTSGTQAAAEWIDANLRPDETYVSAKELAVRATNQRYVDQDNVVYLLGSGHHFDGTWNSEPAAAAIVWQREPYVGDLLARGLADAGFRETARFGDYVVYQPGTGS